MQYPQKDLYGDDMDWKEFKVLLSGLDETTPLGKMVMIRSEEDEDRINNFTSAQKQIRDDYRSKKISHEISTMSDDEKVAKVSELQTILAQAFG